MPVDNEDISYTDKIQIKLVEYLNEFKSIQSDYNGSNLDDIGIKRLESINRKIQLLSKRIFGKDKGIQELNNLGYHKMYKDFEETLPDKIIALKAILEDFEVFGLANKNPVIQKTETGWKLGPDFAYISNKTTKEEEKL